MAGSSPARGPETKQFKIDLALSESSEVEHDIGLGLRAADQHVVGSRRLDRIELIADGAGYKRRFATVADPGAARPSDGHVTGFGKFEQAVEWPAPSDIETAARE